MHYLAQLLVYLALRLPYFPLFFADDDQLLFLAGLLLALLEDCEHALELVLGFDGGGGLNLEVIRLLVLGLDFFLEELADGLAQEGVGVGSVLGQEEERLEISFLLEGMGFVQALALLVLLLNEVVFLVGFGDALLVVLVQLVVLVFVLLGLGLDVDGVLDAQEVGRQVRTVIRVH